MGHEKKGCCAQETSCHPGGGHSHEDHGHCHEGGHDHQSEFSHQLLEIANEAWIEVIKDKIKQKIIAKKGAQLDKVAELVSDTNSARWKEKKSIHNACCDYKHKLEKILCGE